MSGEFTDSQKAMIRQIVSDSISDHERNQIESISRAVILSEEKEREWLRRSQLDGEIEQDDPRPLPTKEKVENLADEAVLRWTESQPKWYDFRNRLDSAGALVVILSLSCGILYDILTPETKDLRNAVHYLADTDARITHGVETSREDWVKKPAFAVATSNVLRVLAEHETSATNPLRSLITKTTKTHSGMVFHGQHVFRGSSVFQVDNQICENFMKHLVIHLGENDPLGIPTSFRREPGRAQGICRSQGYLLDSQSLDIPFFARFHETTDAVKPDSVRLALHIVGEAKDDDGTAINLSDHSPAVKGPKGVCVTYQTTDKNLNVGETAIPTSGLFIGDKLESIGNGFWLSEDITGDIAKILRVGQVDKVDARHLLHSINLRVVGSGEEKNISCAGVEAIIDAHLIVRAFILVNKPLE